jgi:PKHD-type hydroxylase
MACIIYEGGLPKKDCELIINYFLNNKRFTVSMTGEGVVNEQDRKSDIIMIEGGEILFEHQIADLVYGFIKRANKDFFKYNLDHVPDVQFTRYKDDGYYNWHQDILPPDMIRKENRKLSFTLCLSDPNSYEGGVLEFFNGNQKSNLDTKSIGNVIIFDSWEWHRVTPVTGGVRYSLVSWIFGPNLV